MKFLEEIGFDAERAIRVLDDIQHHDGWKVLQAYIQSGITRIEEEVWNKEDLTKERCDRLRDRRRNLNDLLNAPKKLSDLMKIDSLEEEFDPFE